MNRKQREVNGEEEDEEEEVETPRVNGNGKGVKVILAGHSVGAFIAMEVLRTLGERRKKKDVKWLGQEAEIVGGVMLFPTVMDIAKSPSGRVLSVCTLINTTTVIPNR